MMIVKKIVNVINVSTIILCAFVFVIISAKIGSATIVQTIDFDQTLNQPSDFIITGNFGEWTFDSYLDNQYKNYIQVTEASLEIQMEIIPEQVDPQVPYYMGISAALGDASFIDTIYVGEIAGDNVEIEYIGFTWDIDLGAIYYAEDIFKHLKDGAFKVTLLANLGTFSEIKSSTLQGTGTLIPIPGSLILLASALIGFVVIRRRGIEFV